MTPAEVSNEIIRRQKQAAHWQRQAALAATVKRNYQPPSAYLWAAIRQRRVIAYLRRTYAAT